MPTPIENRILRRYNLTTMAAVTALVKEALKHPVYRLSAVREAIREGARMVWMGWPDIRSSESADILITPKTYQKKDEKPTTFDVWVKIGTLDPEGS